MSEKQTVASMLDALMVSHAKVDRENARLRDSLALVKAAHDKARQILGADVESIEDAAARVVRERDHWRQTWQAEAAAHNHTANQLDALTRVTS